MPSADRSPLLARGPDDILFHDFRMVTTSARRAGMAFPVQPIVNARAFRSGIFRLC
jgi:hypothetical protein